MTIEQYLPRASDMDDARVAAASRYLTQAEHDASRRDVGAERLAHEIACVGVVGAGTMGSGIALVFALAQFDVILMDANADALTRAHAAAAQICQRMVSRGRLDPKVAEQGLQRLRQAQALSELANCDLVIEAVFEDMAVKSDVVARLGAVCKASTVLATNTSSLDVDELAAASGRAEQFLGMHFFSPVHAMRLLEIVRGKQTSPAVLNMALDLAQRLGKVAVVSGVCFGFIGNRMLEGYLREAEALLLEGARPAMIDAAVESIGMAMGPCRMIDLAGVDVAAKVVLERRKSGQGAADPAYRAVVRALFDLGRMGQKSGKGYYRYEGRQALEDPVLDDVCRTLAAAHGIARRSDISAVEIIERCLFPLINEGARIIEEGIAARASDLDVVWVNGYGFPAALGGPMYWANHIGVAEVVSRLDGWARRLGNQQGYWEVSSWLRERAEKGLALVP